MVKQTLPQAPKGMRWIFRASRRNAKTGEKEYARDHKLRGFPILVPI